MSNRKHIVGIFLSAAMVAAFQYVGIMLSWADFHPGYIPDLPEYLHRRARLGSAMRLPFEWPLQWLPSITDLDSTWFGVVRWIVIPLCYGAVLYLAFAFVWRRRFWRANHVS